MKPPPITRVYVAVCKTDFHLTRLCVASVRYWRGEIPISLICDFGKGDFDPSYLARQWRLDIFPMTERKFGWGHSKLEPLFLPHRERYVMLDSDLVLVGPVLDLLEQNPADFVVSGQDQSEEDRASCYFSRDAIARFDPAFSPPRLLFNSGQYLATSGVLTRTDFDPVLEWTSPRTPRHPEIFQCGEQGLFNYVLFKAAAENRITIGYEKFYLWTGDDTSALKVSQIAARVSAPQVLHWNGKKETRIEYMERRDILFFFDRYYWRHSDWRAWWRETRPLQRWSMGLRRLLWRAGQWLAGTSLVEDCGDWPFCDRRLLNFHKREVQNNVVWRWSEPEAGVRLRLTPGRYRVVLETGSPKPMTDLASRNVRFFLDDRPLAITYTDRGVILDLEAADFGTEPTQLLHWTVTKLEVPASEIRTLGLPVTVLRVHCRR